MLTLKRFFDCLPIFNTPRGFSRRRTSYCPGAGLRVAEEGGANRLVSGAGANRVADTQQQVTKTTKTN